MSESENYGGVMARKCGQCKEERVGVNMYNPRKGRVMSACNGCINRKFMAIMTLAKIDFKRIEEEVNGNV